MKLTTRFNTTKAILASALLAALPIGIQAADIFWNGGTASYTNAANWIGGVVPTINDNAFNDSGAGNVVQINSTDPAWDTKDIRAGSGADTIGAFEQNGSSVTINAGWFRLGIGAGSLGTYTLNDGALVNNGGRFMIGEAGAGVFNIYGGTITKSGDRFSLGDRTGSSGIVIHTNGTVNSTSEIWVGQGGGATGQYDLSGTGRININNWLAVGRAGSVGVMNISGGTLVKAGNGNIVIGAGGGSDGTVNQTGGSITNTTSQTWIAENGTATWNMDGGTATMGIVHIAQTASSVGTLNLNGGTFNAFEVSSGDVLGFSTLNLNGGTLAATGDNPNFLRNLIAAQVGVGGAIFDSKGFNISVAQGLVDNGGGGLTKNGAGTLTLTGANSYTGATMVNEGKLVITTDSTGGADYAVANGANLGVVVSQFANAQLNLANLTFAGSATLDVDLSSFGNPSSAPLNVVGALAVAGTVTINVESGVPTVGSSPLIRYGTRSGAGSFVLGTLPIGVQAHLATNSVNSTIDLVIDSAGTPRWEGSVVGGVWDIGITANWIDLGTGASATYQEGQAVLFNDSATGTTTVDLSTTVHPGSVTVTNDLLSYTLAGAGKISGAVGLVKQGVGALTISNTAGNDYTGPTVISGGTLNVTSLADGGLPSAIGASSASSTNLVLANGTLSYSGPAVSINRGYTVQNTNSTIDAQTDLTLSGLVTAGAGSGFVKTGPARLTYTTGGSNELSGGGFPGYHVAEGAVFFGGSAGGQTNHSQNEFWVGGTPDVGASVVLTNTTLLIDSWLGVGRGNGSLNNLSTLSLYNSTMNVGNVSFGFWNNLEGNLATQILSLTNSVINNRGLFFFGESGGSTATLNMSGTSIITNRGDVNLTGGAGATATVNISGNSIFGSNNRIELGLFGGTGSMVIADSGKLVVNAWFSVGDGDGANGSLLIKDSGSVYVNDLNITDRGTSTASLTVQDNAVASGSAVYIGKATGSIGTGTLSGGTVISRSGDFRMGSSGSATWTQTGGAVLATNWAVIARNTGSSGVYNISGGSLNQFNAGNQLIVAENGTGTLNMSGTAQVKSVGEFAIGKGGDGNGTVNLNGGTLTVPRIIGGTGVSAINFNGGSLVAGPSASSTFMGGLTTANVLANGLNIDSGDNIINIDQALLDGGGNGGLTKTGSGTLNLNGANTYNGPTVVNGGSLGGTGTIVGSINIASGATLAPGASIGVLTINNALTLSAGSTSFMEVSFDGGAISNDQVTGLTGVTYAGSLIVTNAGASPLEVGNVFKLFNSAVAGSGNFSQVTILPTGTGTFDPATGELTITAVAGLTVDSPSISGGNLILTGIGGTPGGAYTWLTSTNIAAPVPTWTTNTSGTFDGNGAFSNGIPVNAGEPARFFLLRTP